VVVIVSNRHPHSLRVAAKPGLRGDIGEGTVAIVVVQPIPILRVGLVGNRTGRYGILQARAIDEEEVLKSVSVIIQHGDAAGHRFNEVFLRCAGGKKPKSDARLRRYVKENGQGRWLLGRAK